MAERASFGSTSRARISPLDTGAHRLFYIFKSVFLEKVHERPIHLVVVSSELSEFAHIHPELQSDDTYRVSYSFPRGGTYWLFADYTRPGTPQSIARFRVTVKAAKYNDGLLFDPGATAQADGAETIVWREPKTPQTLTIKKAGVYRVEGFLTVDGEMRSWVYSNPVYVRE